MSSKTKRISEVPVLEQATENTNLLVEENGETSRIPIRVVAPKDAVCVSYEPPTNPETQVWVNPNGAVGNLDGKTEDKAVASIVGLALNEMLNATAARYATIEDALAGASATADGKVLAYTCGGGLNIMLLDDISSATTISIAKDCTLHLNGKTLSFTAQGAQLDITTAAEVTINGRVEGSTVAKTGITNTDSVEPLVSATDTHLIVLGGTYLMSDMNSKVVAIRSRSASTRIDMENCVVKVHTIDGERARAVEVDLGNIKNCDIDCASDNSLLVQSVVLFADSNVENCQINAISYAKRATVSGVVVSNNVNATCTNCHMEADGWSDNYNEDDELTIYPVYPLTANSGSTVTINGGYYWGARDGLSIRNIARINGGVFEGCQHGGAYISGSDFKAKNAIFRCVAYKGTVGWENNSYGGAVYCGHSEFKDVNAYFDNCRFEAPDVRAGHGVVAKYTNTKVYLSNCVIDGDFSYDLRVDTGNTIYIGKNVPYETVRDLGGTIDTTTYADQEFGFETEATTSNAILSVKDECGNWIGIPSTGGIQGNVGGTPLKASYLIDRVTGVKYALYIGDGNLKMEVVQ